ncbi:MAG: beta-ketoacyl-[acyl-carrier-protein] synthase II [Planctomycetes bacterium GWF2_41_51]|nr:MAG: beta-ketoacyl-[acyl-carrier-protein] synthase II [Planctomycetes bacterium GWF2_41_51]HBG28612.1 beta-ketoacyl-[acyl-carrier-protein] synthase II [Phycisphaerales bacterium]
MNKRRVVITGLGCVTPIGISVDSFFDAACKGKNGVVPISSFDTSAFSTKFGGEIRDFDITQFVDHREGKRMDRFCQLAVASAVQAIKDCGVDFSKEDLDRCGVIYGSGIGGIQEIETQHIRLLNKGPRMVSPFTVPKLMGNAACGTISMMYGLRAANFCVVTACASASHSIGEAFYNILNDRSDFMVTGGSEAAVSPVGVSSFCALKSLSTKNDMPEIASRPFDIDRDGFVIAEGAGTLILEEYEHAKKRGAKIYAELLGYGATADAHHITAPSPDGEGAVRAIEMALKQAGIAKDKFDYINAHGTSTELNDIAEASAIKKVFGEHAYKLSINSTKSLMGHSLGASGAIELVATCKIMETSIIHPTINLDNVDPRCDAKLDFVPKVAKERKVNYAASNSFGFGGHNACLVVGKV